MKELTIEPHSELLQKLARTLFYYIFTYEKLVKVRNYWSTSNFDRSKLFCAIHEMTIIHADKNTK